MIEEFFIVERKGDYNILFQEYTLLLPDIFSQSENFVQCGVINCEMAEDGVYDIKITLFENFDNLCQGESYTDEGIINSIKVLVSNDRSYDFSKERFILTKQI